MTMREEILEALADLDPTRAEVNKGKVEHGVECTEYKVFFNTPKGEVFASLVLADNLKMQSAQVARVLRSYVKKDLEELK